MFKRRNIGKYYRNAMHSITFLFISPQILQRFALLESSSSFSGIAESLQNQSYQWEEYFDVSFSRPSRIRIPFLN